MAKIFGKDPLIYGIERDAFLRDLRNFHDARGTPFRRCPQINGQEIDLYLLYSLVTAQGGWVKVNSKHEWPELLKYFKLTGKCMNSGVALKQIYLRYLDRWEKVHYMGEEGDRPSDEEDNESNRHKRWSARALHSVPLSYNYYQHNVNETSRENNNLSLDLYRASDYDRLALSLVSPLPNEQDFAINVCTVLSNDGKHTLKLEKHPRLIDNLLAHAAVFNHPSLRKLFVHYYKEIRRHPFDSFWSDVLVASEFLHLADETYASSSPNSISNTAKSSICDVTVRDNLSENSSSGGSECDNDEDRLISGFNTSNINKDNANNCSSRSSNSNSSCVNKKLEVYGGEDDRELFCLERTLGTQDFMGQRVLQIAHIMRNLSFVEDNVTVLTSNRTFLRFVLLCANSRWNSLQSLGFDMLSNVANEFLINEKNKDRLSDCLLKVVTRGLHSEDRNVCITSLDVLNKLAQTSANEDAMSRRLDKSAYRKMCSFLTLHDVMLLVYALECLYSLSSLGERPCNSISTNHGVVDTLVSLVTVEGKSYGPKACIGMKLVETVCGGSGSVTNNTNNSTANNNSNNSNISSNNNNATPSIVTSVSTAAALTPVVASFTSYSSNLTATVVTSSSISTNVAPTSTVKTTQIKIITQSNNSNNSSSNGTTTSSPIATPTPSPPPPLVQQHAHQQTVQENEQFALAWLRATYEPHGGVRIDQQELYKQYINACAKGGRRGVIAPLHFPRCVRSVFGGSIGPRSNDSHFYEGIRARVQRPITPINCETDTPPASPASPILKAQLSAPNKNPTTVVIETKSQVMAHPHLSHALLGVSSAVVVATSTAISSNSSFSSNSNATPVITMASNVQQQQSNTSLIKSLLATKVNECMSPVSMKIAKECQNVAQVAARQQQQRLLAATPTMESKKTVTAVVETPKSSLSRPNGARQLFPADEKSPPAPPPLAPLSAIETSIADGPSAPSNDDDSLTSFEGILNGVPSIEALLNDDDGGVAGGGGTSICRNRPLMLADLLERRTDREPPPPPPLANGLLMKDRRLGDKTGAASCVDLVENHIERALKQNCLKSLSDVSNGKKDDPSPTAPAAGNRQGTKRPSEETAGGGTDAKRAHINGSDPAVNGDDSADGGGSSVSNAAAKLFADFAADILEDEEEEQQQQQQQQPVAPPQPPQLPRVAPEQQQQQQPSNILQMMPHVYMDGSGTGTVGSGSAQPLMVPRQIIVSSPTSTTLKAGQAVIMPQSTGRPQPQVVIQQANAGGHQFLLSAPQGHQMQLVPSVTQPGQFVLQAGGAPGAAYVVAQAHHGQPQTVLVAQTPQQQGTGTKTIIILQQPGTTAASGASHQKVVVASQGQPMLVTQVPRPVLHTAASNATTTNVIVKTPIVTTTTSSTNAINVTSNLNTQATTSGTAGMGTTVTTEKKEDKVAAKTKQKIVRDLSTPFVCEWGDCQCDIKFKSSNQVYLHVCESHCPETNETELVCQWDRCDNMKRKRFSLMTHLYDKHCNTEAMKAAQIRRKQLAQSGKSEPAPAQPATPHPGYAPDAALHAIKRHALEFVNPKELQKTSNKATLTPPPPPKSGPQTSSYAEQDDNEGPVTKSIRLTASLILRNLVIYSNNCRRYLRHYEPHLANVALSNVESSRTIAQILYDMNDCGGARPPPR